MSKYTAAFLALALPLLATAGPVNLVQNGSFEDVNDAVGTQSRAAGTYGIYTSIPGWTSPDGSGIEVRNNRAGKAFDGVGFVELDTTRNSLMLQSITTVATEIYSLSFYYSPRGDTTRRSANTNDITVYWNGDEVATHGGQGDGRGNVWKRYEYQVVGTGTDRLSFRAAGTSDSYGGSLDMVSLHHVPEPGSIPLALAGFAAAAFARRRVTRA